MRRSARVVCGVGAFGVLGWIIGCQSDAAGPNNLVDPDTTEATDTVTLNVSNAVASASLASFSRMGPGNGPGLAEVGEADIAYISLRPGTVPDGITVVIANQLTGALLTTAVIDGGFDPVPVRASAGDLVDLQVTTASGAERRLSIRVPDRKPPKVVRTVPTRGKTGVPLNSSIVIVFSEPVAGGTLTPNSVKVLRAGSAIAGTVRLLAGTTTSAVFEPSASLDPNTVYKLVVTGGVMDLAGDSLSGRVARDFTTGSSVEGDVNSVGIRPDSLEIPLASQAQFTATAYDIQGNAIAGLPITWRSENPAIATVSTTGLVTARSKGYATILADIGGVTGYVILGVAVSPPLASVELSTDSAAIRVGGAQWLYVFLKDSAGNTLYLPRLTQWTSSNTSVATVADSGSRTAYVTGVAEGLAKVVVRVEGKSDTVTILVSNSASIAPRIVATTPANGATGVSRRTTVSVTFSDVIDVTTMGSPNNSSAFTVTGGGGVVAGTIVSGYDNYRTYVFTPARSLESSTTYTARVTTAVRDLAGNPLPADYVWTFTTEDEPPPFTDAASITSHKYHTCILTTSGAAYCWGQNSTRQLGLGDGTIRSAEYAVAAAGSLRFAGLGAGGSHTCGVTAAGPAYCWGDPWEGALGIGGAVYKPEPMLVAGGLSFAWVTAGLRHTCGVTTDGSAYCWGNNSYGVLGVGDATSTSRPTPTSVVGGLTFRRVSAGVFHTCGLTPEGRAYCWGSNGSGELGDGTTAGRVAPVSVAGGLTFAALSPGFGFTCGVTSPGAAYCWGANGFGALGDGTTISRPTPVPVTGGLRFTAVTTGEYHSCGVTVAGAGYCWGVNTFGQLGDGTTTTRTAPVPVAGGLTFTAIATGARHSCGVTASGGVYCWGENSTGQLGNNSTTNSSVPVRVRR